ncbi:MAG: serine hydrolase domain-containing protein, partial [Steroidobacteraceae bacterium]
MLIEAVQNALAAALLLAIGGTAAASTSQAPAHRTIAGASAEPSQGSDLTKREDLEAFIDGVMATQLRSQHVAGATIAIVRDGQLFFAKGYGYEDVERKVPVDPEKTLFRVGSISKLFTATAVMQLVEAGKLDLDADVNTYLTDFKIPDTYPEPVTIRNLLTHTAGFEDGGLGYFMERSADGIMPLGAFLALHMPARVRPPTTDFASSTGAAYSNWGAALAGHIVATVSGVPFDEYVEQRILQPLGMARSTFREPLPAELAVRMSGGYTFANGVFSRHGFAYIHNFGPAGSLSSTAADMAKFMIAHLQDGVLGDRRILREETARLMHARALSPDPAVNGMCLGFYDTWVNGRRLIGHDGGVPSFVSDLMLIPEANVGLFVSTNSSAGGNAIRELENAFMDRYFPARLPDIKSALDSAARAARYSGTYRAQRRSYTKLDKIAAATGDIHVQPGPDGTLLISSSDGPRPAVEIGEGVFRRKDA